MSVGTPQVGTYTARTSESSTAVPYPATVNAGDILVLVGSSSGSNPTTAITTPAGWTDFVRHSANSDANLPVLWGAVKNSVAAGTEGGTNVTVTHSSGVDTSWQILAFPGGDQTTFQDFTATFVQNTSTGATTSVIPAGTATKDGVALVCIAAQAASAGSATPPSGFTETGDRDTPGTPNTRTFEVSYKLNQSTGDTGSQTVTFAGSGRTLGSMLAIRPAASALTLTATDDRGLTDGLMADVAKVLTDASGLTDGSPIALNAGAETDDRGMVDAAIASVATVLTDSRGLSDVAGAGTGITQTSAETRGLTDAGLAYGLSASIPDDRGLTDTGLSYGRAGAETDDRGSTDSRTVLRIPALLVNADDNRGLADPLYAIDVDELDADDRGVTDSLASAVRPVVSDSRGLADTLGFGQALTFTDERKLTDARELDVELEVTESLGVTDTPGADVVLLSPGDITTGEDRGLSDTIGISRSTDENRGLSDTTSAAVESVVLDGAGWIDAALLLRAYTFTDARVLTDAVTMTVSSVTIDERGLSDGPSVTLLSPFAVEVSEDNGLADGVTFAIGSVIGDNRGLADPGAATVLRSSDDDRGLVDSTDLSIDAPLVFTDDTGLTDQVHVIPVIIEVTEELGLTDDIVIIRMVPRNIALRGRALGRRVAGENLGARISGKAISHT